MNTDTDNRGLPRVTVALIAVAVGGVGYGLGHFQAGMVTADAKSQLEESQLRVKRGEESVGNVEKRVAISDAYRHVLQAYIALEANEPDQTRSHLDASVRLMSQNDSNEIKSLVSEASLLSRSPDLIQKRSEVMALADRFERMIPRPIGVVNSSNSAPPPK